MEKESWFWNSEVQEAVEAKKSAFKEWQRVKNAAEPNQEEKEAAEQITGKRIKHQK